MKSTEIVAIIDKDGEWIQPGRFEEFQHAINQKYILFQRLIGIGIGEMMFPLRIVEGEAVYAETKIGEEL